VFRSNLVGKRSRVDPRVLMAALLYSLVSVWGVTQTAKNVYDATFMLPLWLLASWLALSGANLPSLAWACIRCFTVGIASLAMISVIALAVSHGPSLVKRAMAQDELPGQPYSIPNFRFADTAAEIETTARMCHIPTDTTGHALMIDENTYFIAMRSHRPQFHLGVVGVWHGGITDPIAYLRGLGSDGALVACRNLPPALRQHAHRSGNFCCLGPPGW